MRAGRMLWIAPIIALGCGIDVIGTAPLPGPSTSSGAPAPAPGSPAPELGNGSEGDVELSSPTTLNAYAAVTAEVAAGAASVPVGQVAPSGAFAPGDLVLLWQTAGSVAPAPNDTSPIDLGPTRTGAWMLARVATATIDLVTLDRPADRAYGVGAQLIKAREYANLKIARGGVVTALPWNGTRGGAVVLFATGTVTIDGAVRADAVGFRGGALSDNGGPMGCAALDGDPKDGYAMKGEGIAGQSSGGMAASANGGGGGNCHNAGGGGGGNGGKGGTGGRSWDNNGRPVGGRGGSALVFDPQTRLTLGGGGGAGDANGNGKPGGRGGGAIFVRARALAGTGRITANGGSAQDTSGDGGSGGGAGGTVDVRVIDGAACGTLEARGGNGGKCDPPHGPGAGGGGGRVLLVSGSTAACAPVVSAGQVTTSEPDRRSATPAAADDPEFRGIADVRVAP